jgi:ribosomal protein L21
MLDVKGIKKKLPSNENEYAIVKSNGRPMPVSIGDRLYVLGKTIAKWDGEKCLISKVYKRDGKLQLHNGEAVVYWTLIDFIKGEKLTIQHFKNKSRQKRRMGYRNKYVVIAVDKIEYR